MTFDVNAYMSTYKDVDNWWKDSKRKGLAGGKGIYHKAHGRDTTGWEENWVKGMNKKYGTDKKDVGDFTKDEYAKYHYDTYGKKEKRLDNKKYKDTYSKLAGRATGGDGTGGTYEDEPTVDTAQFQQLLDRLTTSKKQQQRQKSVEGRRDIYAGGLASMMANF